MKALVLNAEAQTASVQDLPPPPTPTPGSDDLFIRVDAIALNPVDALYTSHPLGATGRIVGSDFAGRVVAPDPDTGGDTPGRLVAGFLQGACSVNDRPGAFAQQLLCPRDLVWTVPAGVPAEEAAAVSLCGLTAAQALFFRLGLEAPFAWGGGAAGRRRGGQAETEGEAAEPVTVLVYGASTSVGLYAAQLVRRSAEASGRRVTLIGAASKARHEMLREEPYAYDVLVDYRDEDWHEQVLSLSPGADGVDYAYDCISEGDTVQRVDRTLRKGSSGVVGKIAVVRSRAAGAWDGDGLSVEPIYGAVWEGLGADINYQKLVVRATPETRAFAVAFYAWLSERGGLKANPIRLMPGGLSRVVPDGFTLLGSSVTTRNVQRSESWMKPLSAEKMVYMMDA